MNVRELLPKDWKSLVRLLVMLMILKVIINAALSRVPPSIQGYMPNLG